MDLNELLTKANDTITVRRVFGEPIHSDGAMVIPVAWIAGGAGGGGGDSEQGTGFGGGSGFSAGPAGVYRVKDVVVTWHPSVNINRAILGVQALIGLGMLVALFCRGRHGSGLTTVAIAREFLVAEPIIRQLSPSMTTTWQ